MGTDIEINEITDLIKDDKIETPKNKLENNKIDTNNDLKDELEIKSKESHSSCNKSCNSLSDNSSTKKLNKDIDLNIKIEENKNADIEINKIIDLNKDDKIETPKNKLENSKIDTNI